MDWTGILVGGAVAGFVLFCWYGVAWMALHHHKADYVPVPDKDGLEKVLERIPPKDAWYALPHHQDYEQGMKDPEFEQRLRRGPNAFLVVSRPGPAMEGGAFASGLVLNILEGIGCAVLLVLVDGSLAGIGQKIGFFAILGLAIALTTYGAQTIYAKYPMRFTVTNAVDKTVGYALVGLVLHLLGPTLT